MILLEETSSLHSSQAPSSIGPYRLGERLGRGGMGEVYRGYDDRLDRPVALKRVRREVGDPEVALRRFQREARAAARLRHPAIVQVHDWVDTEEDAWLVMELVEGRSLRDLLHGGPLEPARAVALAHDLLEGLAVAHDAGLVHRDLKADNVMITPVSSSGRGRLEQAKILDFGLAKQSRPDAAETQLSIEGKILGTLSAMAPEQVLGQEVDARTDLFALGCLLYEALTGRQPFVGRSAGETLNRVCTVYQVPVKERHPEVSASLSAFVDHLLEKDPRRRPATAHQALDELDRVSDHGFDNGLDAMTADLHETIAEATAPPFRAPGSASVHDLPRRAGENGRTRRWLLAVTGVAVLATLGVLFFGGREVALPTESTYVAVPPTLVDADATADAQLAAQGIHSTLLQGLVDLEGIVPVEVPSDQKVTGGARALARSLAADEVLASRLDCGDHGCRAELSRVRGKDAVVLWAQAFTADPGRLLDLSQAVLGFLPRAFPGSKRREGAANLEVAPADYETFLRLERRYQSRDRGLSSEQLLASLAEIARNSPRYLAVPLLEAHVALQRFQAARDEAYLERAGQAVERAQVLAPNDPQVMMLAARAARAGGELEEARRLLDRVRALEPGNAEATFQLARLHEQEGDQDRAEQLALEAVTRWPAPNLYLNTADLFYRQGNFERARELIESGLERAPDSYGGLSRLAQLELAHGDLERAAELYTRLVERSPEETELTNLGTSLLMLGRYDEAASYFRRVAESSPGSPFATLNLADVENLSGRRGPAEALYARVLDLAADDPQPERLASVKAQALAHLGSREEAVEAIQTAIRQRPDHPWVAFEAALVYALIGDRASALWNARRALEGGIERRWFSLPWFDALRTEIEEI